MSTGIGGAVFFLSSIYVGFNINAPSYVSVSPLSLQNKLILRVDCSPSAEPVFLEDHKQQYFFVRQSAQTSSYNLQETVNYIQSHF